MAQEKTFVNGMIVKRNDNAPNWVICNLSIKVEDLIEFLQQNNGNGWVNVNIIRGQSGKIYAALDDWKPNQRQQAQQQPQQYQQQPQQQQPLNLDDPGIDDIPF